MNDVQIKRQVLLELVDYLNKCKPAFSEPVLVDVMEMLSGTHAAPYIVDSPSHLFFL
jgi:hypothetical protein